MFVIIFLFLFLLLSSSNIFQNNEDISTLLQLPSFINFDFSKSIPIISPDKSFALFYDESTIINVDLKSKKIDLDERVSDLQVD